MMHHLNAVPVHFDHIKYQIITKNMIFGWKCRISTTKSSTLYQSPFIL